MGRISASLWVAAFFVMVPQVAQKITAQEPELPAVRGSITAVELPEGFDVDAWHVILTDTTQFVVLHRPNRVRSELLQSLRVGASVEVIGDKDRHNRTVTARMVRVRDETQGTLSDVGVIDRVLQPGAQPVFSADGYVFHLSADTQVRFSGGIKSIEEIAPGVWVRYQAHRDSSGAVIADRLEFIKPKPHKSKVDPAKFAQVTTFPPGSIIDFDGTFTATPAKRRIEDAGGPCGWYPVPDVPSVQENVRRIGNSLIPAYQRELPADSPEKIHFRFYVVTENTQRSDLFCHEGLVLIPVDVFNRLQNKDQVAAVLADGIAASLQQQHLRLHKLDKKEIAELAVFSAIAANGGAFGFVGGAVLQHQINRRMEDQRGRVALSLMADAGFDPWQAPEAWRMLAPSQLPRNPEGLKYPARSSYMLDILGLEYPKSTKSSAQQAEAQSQ